METPHNEKYKYSHCELLPKLTSKFTELYKCNNVKTKSNQEGRRKEFLEQIRLKRSQIVNQSRDFVEELNENVDDEMNILNGSDDPDRDENGRKRKGNYTNRVMHSEWLTEVPQDLEQNWVGKLCPIGSRRLIFAKYNSTLAFNRYGKVVDRFSSALPGGSFNIFDDRVTLLDCIYSHQLKCYFVLDILVWSANNFENNDTECRFFLLKSKLNEYPELGQHSQFNHRCFFEIDYFCPTRAVIQERMANQYVVKNQTVFVDGLLFYHKETPYVAGPNPLVGWLKPHMLPEMFKISVSDCYLDEKFCKALDESRKNEFFQNEELFNGMDTN